MKRFFCVFLALILIFTMSSVFTAGADVEEGDIPEFELEGDVLTYYNGDGGNVVIPSTVKTIGNFVFANMDDITSVAIPSSVTRIEYGAFLGCDNLTSVSIASGCKYIGSGAFSMCTSLSSVTIPNSVTEIADSLFEGDTALTSVKLSSALTVLPDSTFSNCTALTSYTIPSGITSLGSLLFMNCSNLTTVTFPSSVSDVGDMIFYSCDNLEQVLVPESLYTSQFVREFLSQGITVNIIGLEDSSSGGNPPSGGNSSSSGNTSSIGNASSGNNNPSGGSAAVVAPSGSNFKKGSSYGASFSYSDVSSDKWYYSSVKNAYEYSLMYGKSASGFSPDSTMTVAEAITIACRLYCIYNGLDEIQNSSSGNWYDAYVAFAISKGIIASGDFADYDADITRAQMAKIFAATLPSEWLTTINTVSAVPDMGVSDYAYAAVLTLYRAGICVGSDSARNYCPTDSIKRSEVAAIITRLADKSLRISFSI